MSKGTSERPRTLRIDFMLFLPKEQYFSMYGSVNIKCQVNVAKGWESEAKRKRDERERDIKCWQHFGLGLFCAPLCPLVNSKGCVLPQKRNATVFPAKFDVLSEKQVEVETAWGDSE